MSRHVAISGPKDDDDMWGLDSCCSGRRTAADSLKEDPKRPGRKNEPLATQRLEVAASRVAGVGG